MRMNHAATTTITLLALWLGGCATPEVATTPAVKGAPDPDLVFMPGSGRDGQAGNMIFGVSAMTFAEVDDCSQKLQYLLNKEDAMDKRQREFKARLAVLNENQATLDRERAKVNTHDSRAVDEFNARLGKQEANASQYNADLNEIRRALSGLGEVRNQFNTRCAHRAYRHSDFLKLDPELRAVLEANSTTSNIPIRDDATTAPQSPAGPSGVEWAPPTR